MDSISKLLFFLHLLSLLEDLEDTVKLAKEFEAIGISAIGVHGRKKKERPQNANNAGLLPLSTYSSLLKQ